MSYMFSLFRFLENLSFLQRINPSNAWDFFVAFLTYNDKTERFENANYWTQLLAFLMLLLPSLLTYVLIKFLKGKQ